MQLLQLIIALSSVASALMTAHDVPVQTIPIRCCSRQAAQLIQNRTVNDDGGLLIITCDASGRGGGSKHDGIASVLRVRHGVALFHRLCASASLSSSLFYDENDDLIDLVSRRTVPSRTSSEVAAIALGVKRAIKTVPLSLRNKVLILSDSEFALDFYCGEKTISSLLLLQNDDSRHQRKKKNSSNSGKRRGKRLAATARTTELREQTYWRLFATLLNQTPGGVMLSKVKSSSRSVGMSTGSSGSSSVIQDGFTTTDDDNNTSWDGKGFLDHDAADYLSSNARYVTNSINDEDGNNVMLGTKLNELDTAPFRAVSSLGLDDMKWLAYSDKEGFYDGELLNDDIWNEIIVKGSEAREDRRKRKECRIGYIQGLLLES